MIDLNRLQKSVSFYLKHSPWKSRVPLNMDEFGFVDTDALIEAVRDLTLDYLEIICLKDDTKYEFNEDKTRVRALSEHTINWVIDYKKPLWKGKPSLFYYAVPADKHDDIVKNGLTPLKNNHFVHFFRSYDDAASFGIRKYADNFKVITLTRDDFDAPEKIYRSVEGKYLVKGPVYIKTKK